MVARPRTIHHPTLLQACGQQRRCQPLHSAAVAWLILPGSNIWVPLAASSLAGPAQSECISISIGKWGRFYFSLSPSKLHLAVTFLQQLKGNSPQPASLGNPGLC